mmetsp:Transcript_18890/g.38935  ORF Transcript_18890/g.38935 Transcript_18890/m.38935 type:complete len:154 (-) Transcript_18890:313-774(-)
MRDPLACDVKVPQLQEFAHEVPVHRPVDAGVKEVRHPRASTGCVTACVTTGNPCPSNRRTATDATSCLPALSFACFADSHTLAGREQRVNTSCDAFAAELTHMASLKENSDRHPRKSAPLLEPVLLKGGASLKCVWMKCVELVAQKGLVVLSA